MYNCRLNTKGCPENISSRYIVHVAVTDKKLSDFKKKTLTFENSYSFTRVHVHKSSCLYRECPITELSHTTHFLWFTQLFLSLKGFKFTFFMPYKKYKHLLYHHPTTLRTSKNFCRKSIVHSSLEGKIKPESVRIDTLFSTN